MLDSYNGIILELKTSYSQLRWYQKLFFPAQLASQLEEYTTTKSNNQDKLRIFTLFEKKTWFFQKWLLPSLQKFYNNHYTEGFRALDKTGLLTGQNAQANFNTVVAHPNLNGVAAALSVPSQAGLLTGQNAQANFNALVAHQASNGVANALEALYQAGLLAGQNAQVNFNTVVAHQNPNGVAIALKSLNQASLLTGQNAQANFNAVVVHQYLYVAANALKSLYQAGLLTGQNAQANFNTVVAHPNLHGVAAALSVPNQAGLLTGQNAQANFNAVVVHQYPYVVTSVLKSLYEAGLLTGQDTQANFNAVVAHQDPYGVADALSTLRLAGLLTGQNAQANFNALLDPNNAILLHEDNEIWNMIPNGRPTATEFQAMIAIAQNHRNNPEHGRTALLDYVNNNILNQHGVRPAFNPDQSTHTASVHASVSKSATNLLVKYRSEIEGAQLNKHINEFASCVHSYAAQNKDNTLYQAAARGISRIADANYEYVDKASGVSTRQLLALAWIAISDEEARIGTIGDAQTQLIEGLYEIQRGYNLAENNADDNTSNDRAICMAGTFNKLCEKLAGLHPDVAVLYITKKGATTKLPIVVVEEAKKYLNTLKHRAEEFLELQNKINEENMQPLWSIISPNVAARLFDEFGSLYSQGKESQSFTEFVEQGIYALTKDSLILHFTSVKTASAANSNHTLFGSTSKVDLTNEDNVEMDALRNIREK